jgi:hypothetical protein
MPVSDPVNCPDASVISIRGWLLVINSVTRSVGQTTLKHGQTLAWPAFAPTLQPSHRTEKRPSIPEFRVASSSPSSPWQMADPGTALQNADLAVRLGCDMLGCGVFWQ